MRLQDIQEARHHRTLHPWIATFFDTFWDPTSSAWRKIPDDVDLKVLQKALTQQFGQPQYKYSEVRNLSMNWKVPLPDDLKNDPIYHNTPNFTYSYVTLTPQSRSLATSWE
mgnify:CR=1 FL=1